MRTTEFVEVPRPDRKLGLDLMTEASATLTFPGVASKSPPVWLLDVDGVINASRPAWGVQPASRVVAGIGGDFKIRWARELATRIVRLHRSGVVEVRWCTSWCPVADRLEMLFGFPSFERMLTLEDTKTVPALTAAKQREALRVVSSGRSLVWTDDEAIPRSGPVFDALAASGVSAHLVIPKPRRGLTPADLRGIEEFAGSH